VSSARFRIRLAAEQLLITIDSKKPTHGFAAARMKTVAVADAKHPMPSSMASASARMPKPLDFSTKVLSMMMMGKLNFISDSMGGMQIAYHY
jgi:hypothetical protein